VKRGARLCAAGAVVALAGCDPRSDTGSTAPAVPGAPVEIEAVPALSVGVLGGDLHQEFDRVVRPFVLPDGRST